MVPVAGPLLAWSPDHYCGSLSAAPCGLQAKGEYVLKITKTTQPAGGPADKPRLVDPVVAGLNVPVYYMTSDRGPVPSMRGIVCTRAFAETVLTQLEEFARKYGFGLVHIGVYVARKARHADGTPIVPVRWSNHSFGEAIDFKGIITQHGEGDLLTVPQMETGCPAKLKELLDKCRSAINGIGRRPEIVDDGGWYHLGIHRS